MLLWLGTPWFDYQKHTCPAFCFLSDVFSKRFVGSYLCIVGVREFSFQNVSIINLPETVCRLSWTMFDSVLLHLQIPRLNELPGSILAGGKGPPELLMRMLKISYTLPETNRIYSPWKRRVGICWNTRFLLVSWPSFMYRIVIVCVKVMVIGDDFQPWFFFCKSLKQINWWSAVFDRLLVAMAEMLKARSTGVSYAKLTYWRSINEAMSAIFCRWIDPHLQVICVWIHHDPPCPYPTSPIRRGSWLNGNVFKVDTKLRVSDGLGWRPFTAFRLATTIKFLERTNVKQKPLRTTRKVESEGWQFDPICLIIALIAT